VESLSELLLELLLEPLSELPVESENESEDDSNDEEKLKLLEKLDELDEELSEKELLKLLLKDPEDCGSPPSELSSAGPHLGSNVGILGSEQKNIFSPKLVLLHASTSLPSEVLQR
jgi:hypothetical protein